MVLIPNQTFNAAQYLFVSHHLACFHPDLEQSRIILEFSTPWPKRSYKENTTDVKSTYQEDSSSFLLQFLQRILIFLLSNFLSISPSLQDGAIHLMSTSGLGYLIPVFMKLYEISPVLVIGMGICVLVLIHFSMRHDNRTEMFSQDRHGRDTSQVQI